MASMAEFVIDGFADGTDGSRTRDGLIIDKAIVGKVIIGKAIIGKPLAGAGAFEWRRGPEASALRVVCGLS